MLYTQFKTGAVDVTGIQGISAEFFSEAKALPGVTVHQHATPSVEYIYFNHGRPQFKEVAVRQALYAAVDKKAIIDQIYYGIHKPVEGYLPATSWAYNADLPKQEYNPEKAKQILEESGWKVGADGIRAKNGVRLAFTNSTTAGNKLREQTQALIQQNWKTIGVDMQINNMPAAVVWPRGRRARGGSREAPAPLPQAPGSDTRGPAVPAALQLRAARGREAGHGELQAQQQHADQ